MSLAAITLVGHLGQDAELRFSPTGSPIARFSVACSSYQGSGERRQEHTDWYTVVLFGKRAEAVTPHLVKGVRVTVLGRFQHRQFTRQDGSTGCALDVVASELDFSGGPRRASENAAADEAASLDELPF